MSLTQTEGHRLSRLAYAENSGEKTVLVERERRGPRLAPGELVYEVSGAYAAPPSHGEGARGGCVFELIS